MYQLHSLRWLHSNHFVSLCSGSIKDIKNWRWIHTYTHTSILLISFPCSYINYSQIAARLVRQALKADLRVEAGKRDEANVKFTQWKDGKPISALFFKSYHWHFDLISCSRRFRSFVLLDNHSCHIILLYETYPLPGRSIFFSITFILPLYLHIQYYIYNMSCYSWKDVIVTISKFIPLEKCVWSISWHDNICPPFVFLIYLLRKVWKY